MSKSRAIQIRDEIVTKLEAVSFTNSASETLSVKNVVTGRIRSPFDRGQWPYIHVQYKGRDNTGQFTPVAQIYPTVELAITGIVKAPEDYEPDADLFATAIEEALTGIGVLASFTTTGIIDVRVQRVEVFEIAPNPWAACQVNLQITYEYGFGNPDG